MKDVLSKIQMFPCINNNSCVTFYHFTCVCDITIKVFTEDILRNLVLVSACRPDGITFSIYSYDWRLLFTENAKGITSFLNGNRK